MKRQVEKKLERDVKMILMNLMTHGAYTYMYKNPQERFKLLDQHINPIERTMSYLKVLGLQLDKDYILDNYKNLPIDTIKLVDGVNLSIIMDDFSKNQQIVIKDLEDKEIN